MTRAARRGAILHRTRALLLARESNQQLEGFSREKNGVRDGRLRDKLLGVYHNILGDNQIDQSGRESIDEILGREGVLRTTVLNMYRNMRDNRAADSHHPVQQYDEFADDIQERGGGGRRFTPQSEPGCFPAEYVGFSDLTILLMGGPDEIAALQAIQSGTYYKDRFEDGLENETWGIVISLQMVNDEVEDYKKWLKELSIRPPRDEELYEVFFLFNLLHEYFHYLSELASLYDANEDERYDVYDEYLRDRCKGILDYNCNLFGDYGMIKCCKVRDSEFRTIREFDEKMCGCKKAVEDGALKGNPARMGLWRADKGYQYPVEEAMANAYAMNRLRTEKYLVDGVFSEYVRMGLLGYADFDIFRGHNSNKFQLGERIMTRLMRGNADFPTINQLQWELLEGKNVKRVERLEKSLFPDAYLDNAYRPSRVHNAMKEVPLFVVDQDVGGNILRWFNQFDPNGKMPRQMSAPGV